MSGSTALDVRWPIGGLFTALGIILGGYGLATNGDVSQYARSLSVNINLWWGLVMFLFGLTVLISAARGGPKLTAGPVGLSPEGMATEAREHRLGLEHENEG